MLALSCHVNKRHLPFSRNSQLTLEVELAVSPEKPIPALVPIARLTERILVQAAHILPFTEYTVREENGETLCLIENLRGRPEEAFSDTSKSSAYFPDRPRLEELFFSEGVVYEPPANLEDYPERTELLNASPFTYALSSSFHSFSKNGSIVHNTIPSASGPVTPFLKELSPRRISRLVPARLKHVRLGFESFRPKFWGTWLGVIPRIEGRMFLEIAEKEIHLHLEQLVERSSQVLPFEKQGLISVLDSILEDEGLFCGFTAALRAKLVVK
jgi:hypothetical protein